MFAVGNECYIVSSSDFSREGLLKIKKLKIIKKISDSKFQLDATPPITINEWAMNISSEDAVKMAVTFIINKLEFKKDINKFNIKDFEYLEENHSDLIFKYMDKIVEEY